MKKIAVLGGGISGYGSAILAKKKRFDVFLSDAGRIADRYKAIPKSASSTPRRSSSRPASPKRRRWCENSAPQAFP